MSRPKHFIVNLYINDRFSKKLLQGRLAVLPHRSPSQQFVLTWIRPFGLANISYAAKEVEVVLPERQRAPKVHAGIRRHCCRAKASIC